MFGGSVSTGEAIAAMAIYNQVETIGSYIAAPFRGIRYLASLALGSCSRRHAEDPRIAELRAQLQAVSEELEEVRARAEASGSEIRGKLAQIQKLSLRIEELEEENLSLRSTPSTGSPLSDGSADSDPKGPPIALARKVSQAVVAGDHEDGEATEPSRRSRPHPLALAFQGAAAETRPERPVHPLAAAMRGGKAERPVHPLAAALQGAKSGSGRPVHPLAAAMRSREAAATEPSEEVDGRGLAEKDAEIARLREMLERAVRGEPLEAPPARDASVIRAEIATATSTIAALEAQIASLEEEHEANIARINEGPGGMIKKRSAIMQENTRHDAATRESNAQLNTTKKKLGDLRIELWRSETPAVARDSVDAFISKMIAFLKTKPDMLEQLHKDYHPYRSFGREAEENRFASYFQVILRTYFDSLKPETIDSEYWNLVVENAVEGRNPERGQAVLSHLGVPSLAEVKVKSFQGIIIDGKEELEFPRERTAMLFA